MPLLSDRVRTRIPWLQLAIESVLVVLSVLLALALNAWYDAAQDRAKAERALQGIHGELAQLEDRLEPRIALHAALVDTLRSDSLSFAGDFPGFNFVGPSSEAWQAAQQTGAVGLMDYDVVAPISQAYALTQTLTLLEGRAIDMIFDGTDYLGFEPERLGDIWALLQDMLGVERALLGRVRLALDTIEAEVPALARPDDAPTDDASSTER
jgi:hypothetical protein